MHYSTFLCKYCGHTSKIKRAATMRCPICSDRNLKKLNDEMGNVFGYPEEDDIVEEVKKEEYPDLFDMFTKSLEE